MLIQSRSAGFQLLTVCLHVPITGFSKHSSRSPSEDKAQAHSSPCLWNQL